MRKPIEKIKLSDFPAQVYSDDPQNENTDPLCEHMNWTEEPSAEMCGRCGTPDCQDRITDEG